MIVLNQLANNIVNIELIPVLSVPYWLFVWEFDDLNTTKISTFYTASVSSERYYSFTVDTTAVPMKTGEWVLKVYEMANTGSTDVTGLTASYISKARIYRTFTSDNYNTPTLSDERNKLP